jgi:signal transduction histidine kinase
VQEAFLDIIENGSHGGTQYRHLHKDGHWVYLEAFGNNLLNDPLIQSVVLNVRDVTERKRAEKKLLENEQRLKELNATKDRFISIIGHDLKNPFNTIIGFSELLLDDIKNNNFSDIEQYARHINESSHRVNELLTNLLTWSRTQSGRISFKPEKTEVEKILADIKALLYESARNKSISIQIPTNSKNYVLADMDMLHTIIRNLVSNGIKFTPEGGEISIHISTKNDKLIIAVSDTGVGIPKEKISDLFHIESTESTTGTNGEKGTGFGLLLAKEFVDQHSGEIWVENNEGNGVTFKFTLPSA